MRVTLKDVAQATGLAVSTVSRALRDHPEIREETRALVQQAAAELGYAAPPRKPDPSGTARHLLVCTQSDGPLPLTHELVLSGVRAFAEEAGVALFLVGPTLAADGLDGLLDLVQGALFIMPFGPLPAMDRCRRRGLPVAVANRTPAHVAPSRVDIAVHADEARIAELIVQHLAAHRHRRIAFAATQPGNVMMRSRAASLRAALAAAGLPVLEEAFLAEAFSPADRLVALFRGPQAPTALVCASDQVALRAIHALRQGGLRVPEDVSVMGVHDLPLAEYVAPPLATVAVPLRAIGYETARLLAHWHDAGAERTIDVTFTPRLVPRASVQAVREA